MIGAGDPMLIYDMGRVMVETLRRQRPGQRQLADWLGYQDCGELIRAIRREARP